MRECFRLSSQRQSEFVRVGVACCENVLFECGDFKVVAIELGLGSPMGLGALELGVRSASGMKVLFHLGLSIGNHER